MFVPYVFCRYQSGDVSKTHPELLCYDAVSIWSSTGQFPIHLLQLFSNTSTSSATSKNGTVAERLSRNEEQSSIHEERSRNTPSFNQIPAQMKHREELTWTFMLLLLNFITLSLCYLMNFIKIFQFWKVLLIFVYTHIYCVGAVISTLMSTFNGISGLQFSQKDRKDRAYEGRIGRKAVDFPPQSAFSLYS